MSVSPETRERSLQPLAELALAAVTATAVLSFWRLFADGSFVRPLLLTAGCAHLLLWGCRRAQLGLPATTAIHAVALVLVVAWVQYPGTTTLLLPTGETWRAANDDLAGVWSRFQEVVAPAPVEPGFILASALAVWLVAYVADWAAFRLWVPFEAIVPAGTLFVFASLLGAPNRRGASTALFLASVLGFVLIHRVVRTQDSGTWLTTDTRRGTNSLLRVGASLVVLTVVGAAVIGPNLPGADADALVAWRDIGEDDARQTVSPFVELRRRLIEQSQTELFTVESDVRSYWRLTSLDVFDGSVWSSKGSYRDAGRRLPRDVESEAQFEVVTQRVSVRSLAAIWLPAAYEARGIDSGDVDVRWEPKSSTLIVSTKYRDSDGIEYVVQSAQPRYDAGTLDNASAEIPDDIADDNLSLPDGFSGRARELAQQVTAGASTPFAKARALQDFFQQNFQYSLEVPPQQPGDPLESFLFDSRAGFCQQFAGSYAALARAVGLPTRVAVGFTTGERDLAEEDLFHVRGEHAHAWPEVYLGEFGWVLFEPTPGRGAPFAEPYTGVPERQAESGNGQGATTVPSTATTVSPSDDGSAPQTTQPLDNELDASPLGPLDTPEEKGLIERWVPIVAVILGLILTLALLYVIIVPTAAAMRRSRRRRRAVDADEQIRVAWNESIESMGLLQVHPRRSETPAEFADRSARLLETDSYRELATSVEVVEYSGQLVADEDGARALALADEIGAGVKERTTRRQRLRVALDPRDATRVRQSPSRRKRSRMRRPVLPK